METQYDVFLSHNSKDKPIVQQIAALLTRDGLKVWIDIDELPPGRDWQPMLEQAIKASKSTAVFIGEFGMGTWEQAEVQGALNLAQNQNIPVIPVALPGMPTDVEFPLFLANKTWVRFKTGDDPDALYRLKWGITGEKPAEKPPPRRTRRRKRSEEEVEPPRVDPVEEAVQNLAVALRTGSITYFVGKAAFAASNELPPDNSELAKHLLEDLKLNGEHPMAPVDFVGTCYAIMRGDKLLEDKVTELIYNTSIRVPPLYPLLATLVERQGEQRATRTRSRSHRLIVTTNIDVLLERALVMAGVSFSRIVQHRAKPKVQVNTYRELQRLGDDRVYLPGKGEVPFEETDDLDEWIENTASETTDAKEISFSQMQQPILYKFHGSQDVPDSCAITTAHYLELAQATMRSDFMPRSVQSTIGSSPSLFLDCNPLDADFLVMYYSLLREPFLVGTEKRLRYAPMLPPERQTDFYRKVESRLWSSIEDFILQQIGIRILGERPESFLKRLLGAMKD